MSVDQAVERILHEESLADGIAAYRRLPPRDGEYSDMPSGIDGRLLAALKTRGIDRLYSHQAMAFEQISDRKHTVIVTPTASGKTLCYNLPALNTILQDPDARALYLFPTKALSQDQVAELHALVSALEVDIKAFTYDGDTPPTARRAIRTAGHIVVTNPDMLHTGVLPHHTRWVRLFENLRYVVIDELHVYRGIFGSHVANVIRRLKRICAFYGSDPLFICCSATIANPGELAERIVGEPVKVIDRNGSPSGEKHIIVYNPPVVNKQLGLRASSRRAAVRLASLLIDQQVQTIVFARSRTSVELLLGYLRQASGRGKRESIRGYRGGYLPLERREIERGLRQGTVRGVVATNALELGIDIGQLDAAVLAGFPGTIASAWQQMGRAGRRNSSSLAVLVASSNPLDQFLTQNPEYLFESSPEAGLVDPNNLIISVGHIKCAAFELPFQPGETFASEATGEILSFLEDTQILHQVDGAYHWMSDSFPAQEISLRSVAADNVVIIDQGPPARVVGEVDRISAPVIVHEEAIYIHEGQQYQVERLDLDEKKAFIRAVDVDYYTDAEQAFKAQVLEVFESEDSWAHGEIEMTFLPTIFKKIKLNTHENIGWGKIHLPEEPYHTSGYWLWMRDRSAPRADIELGLVGLAHVLGQVAPLYLMCDPQDLAVWPEIKAPATDAPTIFLCDRVPGGIGLSQRLFALHRELLIRSIQLITGCGCEDGCPSCVGVPHDMGVNRKRYALWLAGILLEDMAVPAGAPR
ncbi:MAG: DEAD/DEAH box helicase [Chloroflexota bacterium]